MKNLFKKQSERNLMIDQGHISIIKSEKQSYYNGEEIKIGEQVLVAIVEVGENNYKTINNIAALNNIIF